MSNRESGRGARFGTHVVVDEEVLPLVGEVGRVDEVSGHEGDADHHEVDEDGGVPEGRGLVGGVVGPGHRLGLLLGGLGVGVAAPIEPGAHVAGGQGVLFEVKFVNCILNLNVI